MPMRMRGAAGSDAIALVRYGRGGRSAVTMISTRPSAATRPRPDRRAGGKISAEETAINVVHRREARQVRQVDRGVDDVRRRRPRRGQGDANAIERLARLGRDVPLFSGMLPSIPET